MATCSLPTHTFSVCASSLSDTAHRKTSTATTAGGKWWAPIFGWSTNADYIDSSSSSSSSSSSPKEESNCVRLENASPKSRFSRGCFTEEKAKQLRMMTKETASFHDAMYHSAIASRLASDFSRRDSSDHY